MSIFQIHSLTPRQMRWSGVLLLFLGAILLGLGGLMLYGLVLSIAAGTVSPGQRIGFGAIVAMGLLAGLTALFQGWWMAFLGRRHWGMLRLLQAIAAAFIVLGMIASLVMGDHPPSRVTF